METALLKTAISRPLPEVGLFSNTGMATPRSTPAILKENPDGMLKEEIE
jgi:hypothetical protein